MNWLRRAMLLGERMIRFEESNIDGNDDGDMTEELCAQNDLTQPL